MIRKLTVFLSILMLAGLFPAGVKGAGPVAGSCREITDMAGRKVKIPANITKVLATSPPPSTFVYMIAPEKLGGWFFSPAGQARKYIPEKFRHIPVLGWGRQVSNYEAYIAAHPDLVFTSYEAGADSSRVDLVQEKFGSIPVVCVDNTRDAVGYAQTLAFMGEILGVPERGRALVDYYQNVLQEVQQKVSGIAEKNKRRVYYAEKENGLATDPPGSCHSQLIEVCGGINVAQCKIASGRGMTQVTMESVLMWHPDIIITTSPEFVRHAYADETWKKVPAVQKQQIHCAPRMPFNWFDRPPGVNRIVGIPWTAHVLYPESFPENWVKTRVKTFFSLFYHYELTEAELLSLIR
ncbi:ABC transporter substrate-binding protein [uncultured Desulfobacter sp.]|uniref:ABC transporter substrate-binding protein n=1 Tax=uncultured Desulfobacter sp. TaxID=240139 RepID=UPI0029F5708E|nr:ABC transporter substrate-binding protein [uncultured Desulfobacter sp.]